MTNDANKYQLAVALLQFKDAFKELIRAADATDDDVELDELYPFYLLDFMVLGKPVEQWTTVNANKLLSALPELVENPACMSCGHHVALKADGKVVDYACNKPDSYKCDNYHKIPFMAIVVKPFLESRGVATTGMSDTEIYIRYTQLTGG